MNVCPKLNLSLKELVRSDTAKKYNISNQPSYSHIKNLKSFCPVLDFLDIFTDVTINSAYRSPTVNKLIPGASAKSSHTKGLAIDVETNLPNFVTTYLLKIYDKNLNVETNWSHVHIGKTSRWMEREMGVSYLMLPIFGLLLMVFFRKTIKNKILSILS